MSGSEDELLRELRDLFDRVDPPPPEVTEFAHAALGWRSLEAELAELLDDSALEAGLATATRGPGEGRRLTFKAAGLSIDMEVGPVVEGARRVLGLLVPPMNGATVEVQDLEGSVLLTVATDELGRFRLELPPTARIRFRVLRPAAQPVESSWVSL